MVKNYLIATSFVLILLPPTPIAADNLKSCFDYVFEQKDYPSAVEACAAAAEEGHASAQFLSGMMYEEGIGVEKNFAEAVRWYTASAEQEVASAQFNLAQMYRNGLGVAESYDEAVRWYTAAAEQGYAKAQSNLAQMYRSGFGVAQNYTSAHMWFNIAAANGYEPAAKNRRSVANLMTAEQIGKAQENAQICISSNYTQC